MNRWMCLLFCVCFAAMGCGGSGTTEKLTADEIEEKKAESQKIAKENAEKYKNYKPGRPTAGGQKN